MMQLYKSKLCLLALISLISIQIHAQITCDDPLVIINDDLESYMEGDVSDQSPDWAVWPGSMTGGIISTEQAESGDNSIKLDGTLDGQDVLLLLGDQTDGHFLLRFDLFVPEGNQAYFNFQHEAPTESAGFWGAEFSFFEDGTGSIDAYDGNPQERFDYPQNAWFEVYIWADIDNDQARININEYTRKAWAFSNAAGDPSNSLNSINFFPRTENYIFYVDNIEFWQIPAAEEGRYCYTAVPAAVGTNSVTAIDCFGGGYDIGGNGSGKKGFWLTYTPEEDGVISIASCNEGVDTRGWIFKGDCQDLEIMGVNDDQCPIEDGGSEWASYREAVVIGGETYYFMWDDAWEDFTFDFELTFTTDDPTPGNFCESAIEIGQGEHIVDVIDGNAALAGPNINNTSSSTTNYAQSEWYAFTPTSDGTVIISSCDGAGSDTHVYVYTGTCGSFSTLELVDQNRDSEDCSASQSQLILDLFAFQTYYIEWIDRWDDEPFFWNLIFDPILATEEELALGLVISPNPAREQIQLQFDLPETVPNLQLRLTNILGATVKSQALGDVYAQSFSLDVEDLPTGTYFLQVYNNEIQSTQKIVIE